MADIRRCLGVRGRPALLTCLMVVATAAVLLQYTCNRTGQAYLLLHSFIVNRPAADSELSKLDVLTPAKERPLTLLTQSSLNVTAASHVNLTSVTSPEPLVEPESALKSPHAEVNYSNGDVGATESVYGNERGELSLDAAMVETSSEQVSAEKSKIRVVQMEDVDVAGAIAPSERDLGEGDLVFHHAPSELIATTPVSASDAPLVGRDGQDREVLEPTGLESPNVQQKVLVEAEPGSLTPSSSAQIPVQVQSSETESQEVQDLVSLSPHPQASREFEAFGLQEPHPDPIIQELQTCKKAINEANRDSADPRLYKGVYKNVAAFSKSYELMEKVFKVYIYREGQQPMVHTGPTVGIYASEGQFIERMKRASAHVTKDASQAHMFFLPYSVQHMVAHLYVPNSHSMLPLATFITDYVDGLARQYPFWNSSQGADHFFVSCHDWGPATARDHPTLRTNAMKVVCNADLTEEFVVGKDASLPEVYIHKHKGRKYVQTLGGPGWNKRPFLAFFAGQMHGRVRPVLLEHWKDKHADMKIYEVLPKEVARITSYEQHMKMSKFCICAAGYEVNSPRIVEAIYYDCVPVIIADNFVLPFSDVLAWDTFSVTIPESDIPRLRDILSAIPERSYRSMQTRLRKVRPHFIWHDKPETYDAFHMILHSVWTSRLHRLAQVHAATPGSLF